MENIMNSSICLVVVVNVLIDETVVVLMMKTVWMKCYTLGVCSRSNSSCLLLNVVTGLWSIEAFWVRMRHWRFKKSLRGVSKTDVWELNGLVVGFVYFLLVCWNLTSITIFAHTNDAFSSFLLFLYYFFFSSGCFFTWAGHCLELDCVFCICEFCVVGWHLYIGVDDLVNQSWHLRDRNEGNRTGYFLNCWEWF
jgi:hypothetical protein